MEAVTWLQFIAYMMLHPRTLRKHCAASNTCHSTLSLPKTRNPAVLRARVSRQGLGKTVQVGAFLGALAASGELPRRAPALVVVPATLLRQWLRELRRWAPELRVIVLHDSFARPPPPSAHGSGAPRPDRCGLGKSAGECSQSSGLAAAQGLGL